MNIGQKIRKLRLEKKLTLAEVGDYLGIKGQSVSAYEQDDANPTAKSLKRLADLFEVNIGYFYDEVDPTDNRKTSNTDDTLKDQLIADLKRDKEFLQSIIKSKLFQDTPGNVNFPKGSIKKSPGKRFTLPATTTLRIA